MSAMSIPLWRVLELTRDPGNGYAIGLDAYPIFDEQQRDNINRLIINHFYLRDIGQETISIFTFMMRRTMREIMPTYNQLYQSTLLKFDPLSTFDMETVRSGTQTQTDSTTTAATSDSKAAARSRAVMFDTPQTALSGNKDYASSGTDTNTSNESSGTNSGTNTSNSTGHSSDGSRTTGRQGSANRMLAEYRSNIINTDMMLLNDRELTTMFMGVWDSGEEIIPPVFSRYGRKVLP